MFNFFYLNGKEKRIMIPIIVFFVLLGIILPQFSSAASWWNPANWADNTMNSVLNALLIAIVAIPLTIIMAFVTITKLLLTAVITFATIGTSYTRSDAVNIGWPIVKDFANMMVVLGFVVIGIATTLRIQEYEAKKLLKNLIIAALLINFSLLICGIFIDASNIVMIFFLNKAGSGISKWVPAISDLSALFSNIAANNIFGFAPQLFGMMFFNFIAGFVYLLYMLLILVRVLTLWMLVILSPLAFVCYVFPATKNIWQMWWKNFFQWCIIVLPAGLFYYIGSQMISNSTVAPTVDLTKIEYIKYISNSISTVLVPGLFLIVGFLVSLQFSAMGASTIMNFANKNKGKIIGGGFNALSKTSGKVGNQVGKLGNYLQGSNNVIGKGAGWMLNNTVAKGANALGNYRATSQKTRSGLGRALEATGAIDTGAAAYTRSEELNKSQKRMTALISEGKLGKILEIAEGKGVGTNPKERGAAIGALLETKNFDMNNAQHVAGLTHFQDHGGDLSKYAEKNPELSEHNRGAVQNTMTKHGVDEGRAKEMVRDSAYQNLGVRGLRDLPVSAINVHLLANIMPTKNGKASDEYSDKQINIYKKYATTGTPEFMAQDAEQARLRATGNTDDLQKANKIRDNIIEINSNPNFS